MGRAGKPVEASPAEAGPEADGALRIKTGAMEEIDAEPVGLRFALARENGASPEIRGQPATNLEGVEPFPVAKDIMSEFVGDDRSELAIVPDVTGDAILDLDVDSVGASVRRPPTDDLEPGGTTAFRRNVYVQQLTIAQHADARPAILEPLFKQLQHRLDRLETLAFGWSHGGAVDADEDVVAPKSGAFGRAAGGQRQHARTQIEAPVGANRRLFLASILDEIMENDPRPPLPGRAQVKARNRQPMADGRHPGVEIPLRLERRSGVGRSVGRSGGPGGRQGQ